jgi:hypothetical protein
MHVRIWTPQGSQPGASSGQNAAAVEVPMDVRRILAAGLLVVLCACPYESPRPAGDPAAAVADERLVGHWSCITPDPDDIGHLDIRATTGGHYEMTARGPASEQPLTTDVFLTDLAEGRVMSVHDKSKTEAPSWYLARYTLHRPYLLEIELAREEPFKDAADPMTVLRKGLGSPGVFVPLFTCMRDETAAPH